MQSGFVQAENFAARGGGRERPERDSARVNRLGIGCEPKADAQIGAETNRGDQVFAGHMAHFFRRSQRRRYDRDARFIGDAVVVDIELTAVAHGRVDQSGKGGGKLVSADEHRALLTTTAQRPRAGQRLLDSRRAGAGENGAECVKDMILRRAQRVVVERLVTRARQITGDLFR